MTNSDRIPSLLILIAAALLMVLGSGCATTDDSDMPWATPASWEGSTQIPGFSGQ